MLRPERALPTIILNVTRWLWILGLPPMTSRCCEIRGNSGVGPLLSAGWAQAHKANKIKYRRYLPMLPTGKAYVDQLTAVSLDKPRRPALPPLGLIVIARCLLHRAMLRLLHRLRQRNPALRRLGQITGPQPMRGKRFGIEPG